MSRFTMMGMVQNRSFMAYPVIKPLDMMFARLALEHVSIFIITVGLVATNILFQVDVIPLNLSDAVCGLLSAVLLGIGFGILNSVIVMMFPLWVIGYVGIILLFWFTSGMIINPETMPAELGYWISWNPLMHSVEWIRKGLLRRFPGSSAQQDLRPFLRRRSACPGLDPGEAAEALLQIIASIGRYPAHRLEPGPLFDHINDV